MRAIKRERTDKQDKVVVCGGAGRCLMNKSVFVLQKVQQSSRRCVVDVSDKIKAIISMERNVYELFTSQRDLQYMPADVAKDSLPPVSISLFTHPIFHFV